MKNKVEISDIVLSQDTTFGTLVVLDWSRIKDVYGVNPNCNLWLIDEYKKQIWAVKRTENCKEPFVFIYNNCKHGWIGKTFSGHEFCLDLSTGKAEYLRWGGK